jgi:putative membrane protein
MTEALMAYLHFSGMILLAVTLAIELLVCVPGMGPAGVRLLSRTDLGYLAAAIVVLATGIARLFWFAKGAAFYAGNPVFWVKLALFVAVGLISIPPTLQFVRWSRGLKAGDDTIVKDWEVVRARRYILVELCLFAAIPLMATLMARGIGIQVAPH